MLVERTALGLLVFIEKVGSVIKHDRPSNVLVLMDEIADPEYPDRRQWGVLPENLELEVDDDPLNAAIRAYVDAQKKELGLV
jgi:hypothetical protein